MLYLKRKKKKILEVESSEQGKGQDCKDRTILWRAMQIKVRHLDLILSVLDVNERKKLGTVRKLFLLTGQKMIVAWIRMVVVEGRKET